jgi:transcriptional regulator with XRE-family HTH domain
MRDVTLTDYRNELGLTVEQLADQLGVSAVDLTAWERDEGACPFPRMLELAVEMVGILAEAPEMERAIAASEAAIAASDARSAKHEAESAEYEKRHAAFMAEHNQWIEARGMKAE